MNKKYLPIILTVISILIVTLFWEKIKLPYDTQNQIYGEYSINLHNPNTDTLRFIFFISLPLLTFLGSYLFFYKEKIFSFKEVVFNKTPLSKDKELINLNLFVIFIIIVLLLEFFIINFDLFSKSIDHVHDGIVLTPSNNAYFLNQFWTSSYIERGLFAQFGPVILWKLLDIKSIGLIHLNNLIFLLLNKILLVLIAVQISKNLLFNDNLKKLYFIILSILSVSLVSYYELSPFPERLFIFLLFFVIFFNSFYKFNEYSFSLFFLGTFSTISILWYIDIGAYINVLLIIIFIYFSIRKELKKIISLFLGITFSWLLFFLIISPEELREFINTTISIYSTVDYYNGLIFPTPFMSGDARSARALLFIIFAGILTIIINFNKNTRLTYNNKTLFLFLFLASILVFKTALSRSDTPHIKVASGFNLFLIYSTGLYFLFLFIENKKKVNFLLSKFKKNNINLLTIFFLLLICIFKTNLLNIKNISNSLSSINNLINYKDEKYLSSDYKELVPYYKNLIKNEKCVQILTNEASLPYLLDKPTCSQYYFMYPVGAVKIQKKFIYQLKNSKPKFILYKSEISTWDFLPKHASLVFDFIEENYSFYSKFKYWTFYQIN
jgi:hypothetical protein